MSHVKIAISGLKTEGSSKVPTFKIIDFSLKGLFVPIAVPQLLQNNLVTGFSKSPRLNS